MPRVEERKYYAHRPPARPPTVVRFVREAAPRVETVKRAARAVGTKLKQKETAGANTLLIAAGAGLGSLGGAVVVQDGWMAPRTAALLLSLAGLAGVWLGSDADASRRGMSGLEKLGYGMTAVGVSNLVAGLVLHDRKSEAKSMADETAAAVAAVKEIAAALSPGKQTTQATAADATAAAQAGAVPSAASAAKVSPLERARAQVARA